MGRFHTGARLTLAHWGAEALATVAAMARAVLWTRSQWQTKL
jgi:hypothetical protein